jgi:imidazolonepropionase-like amidohydrolase
MRSLLISGLSALVFFFAASLSHSSEVLGATLIKNVRIFDGTTPKLSEIQDVLVEANLIKSVGRELTHPAAKIIDGKGMVLSPGFVDAHTHMSLISSFDKLENEYTGIYVGAAGARWLKKC